MQMLDETTIRTIADTARLAVIAEWRRQGHELTGQAARTIDEQVTKTANSVRIDFFIQDYMGNINQGVPASRIPYSPGSGAPPSKYIAGLIRYARLRFGADQREAERIAFAIARTHLRQGMPSIGSKRFSQTGRRTGFIEEALENEEQNLGTIIENAIAESYRLLIESFFRSQLSGR